MDNFSEINTTLITADSVKEKKIVQLAAVNPFNKMDLTSNNDTIQENTEINKDLIENLENKTNDIVKVITTIEVTSTDNLTNILKIFENQMQILTQIKDEIKEIKKNQEIQNELTERRHLQQVELINKLYEQIKVLEITSQQNLKIIHKKLTLAPFISGITTALLVGIGGYAIYKYYFNPVTEALQTFIEDKIDESVEAALEKQKSTVLENLAKKNYIATSASIIFLSAIVLLKISGKN